MNIFVSDIGDYKVIDFGLVKFFDDDLELI